MNNKKGFTLIELLAVIAIIALISLVAIPNIVGLSNGIRKDSMVDDAKKMLSLEKYQVNKNYAIRNSTSHTFTLAELNVNGDIKKDPDGGDYHQTYSRVVYTNSGGSVDYCVALIGSKRHIGTKTECVSEGNLYSRSNVDDGTIN